MSSWWESISEKIAGIGTAKKARLIGHQAELDKSAQNHEERVKVAPNNPLGHSPLPMERNFHRNIPGAQSHARQPAWYNISAAEAENEVRRQYDPHNIWEVPPIRPEQLALRRESIGAGTKQPFTIGLSMETTVEDNCNGDERTRSSPASSSESPIASSSSSSSPQASDVSDAEETTWCGPKTAFKQYTRQELHISRSEMWQIEFGRRDAKAREARLAREAMSNSDITLATRVETANDDGKVCHLELSTHVEQSTETRPDGLVKTKTFTEKMSDLQKVTSTMAVKRVENTNRGSLVTADDIAATTDVAASLSAQKTQRGFFIGPPETPSSKHTSPRGASPVFVVSSRTSDSSRSGKQRNVHMTPGSTASSPGGMPLHMYGGCANLRELDERLEAIKGGPRTKPAPVFHEAGLPSFIARALQHYGRTEQEFSHSSQGSPAQRITSDEPNAEVTAFAKRRVTPVLSGQSVISKSMKRSVPSVPDSLTQAKPDLPACDQTTQARQSQKKAVHPIKVRKGQYWESAVASESDTDDESLDGLSDFDWDARLTPPGELRNGTAREPAEFVDKSELEKKNKRKTVEETLRARREACAKEARERTVNLEAAKHAAAAERIAKAVAGEKQARMEKRRQQQDKMAGPSEARSVRFVDTPHPAPTAPGVAPAGQTPDPDQAYDGNIRRKTGGHKDRQGLKEPSHAKAIATHAVAPSYEGSQYHGHFAHVDAFGRVKASWGDRSEENIRASLRDRMMQPSYLPSVVPPLDGECRVRYTDEELAQERNRGRRWKHDFIIIEHDAVAREMLANNPETRDPCISL